ncbi:hypothetical protein QVD17_03356 [Tagetes erecta]|uniref:Uncharacterized protein n=1 Tax=Tagetes erecta TaxID=13708 RepID=A0AAD8LFK4_TARER|nr:hypothetical protein QVD17_03356 [Tagetes erecta]
MTYLIQNSQFTLNTSQYLHHFHDSQGFWEKKKNNKLCLIRIESILKMNYQSTTPRSNRPRGFMVKHVLQFALFAAFSLWLLYQIRQPAGNGGVGGQLSNDRISNFLGRKGSTDLSKSTLDPHSGLTLEDVTNPGEESEIPRYSKVTEAAEFSSKTGNDNNTLSRGEYGRTKGDEDGSLTIVKSNISFPDENGIPQHVRDKFIGTDSTNSVSSGHRQSQSTIATRVGNGRNGSVEES